MSTYGFSKVLRLSLDDAIMVTTTRLQEEGFGVLTRIDLHEKFQEKLGIDFKNYVILEACNPPYAHKAVVEEENIGLLLPYSVVLDEQDDETVLSVMKPTVAMNMIDNPALQDITDAIESKLKQVFDSIGE